MRTEYEMKKEHNKLPLKPYQHIDFTGFFAYSNPAVFAAV